MNAFKLINPTVEMISADDKHLTPGLPVIASIPNAKQPVSGTVLRVNKKAVSIKLDMDCEAIDGSKLFTTGATVHLPRLKALNDNPAKGYVMRRYEERAANLLKVEQLMSVSAQRARLAAVQAEAESLAKNLATQEEAIIQAWKAGARAPEGWDVFVDTKTTSRTVPKWKDECLTLAEATGRNRDEYEAEVVKRTPPSVSEKDTLNIKRRP